jgi:hypothetical protein
MHEAFPDVINNVRPALVAERRQQQHVGGSLWQQ